MNDVCLIGGEPTIDYRFLEMTQQITEAGFSVSVVTNGLKFADLSFLESAVTAGVKNIVFSLKAVNREGYITYTKRDVFKEVMQSLHNLSSFEPTLAPRHNILVTLCGNMMHDFDSLLETIRASGVKKVTFDTERPIIDGGKIIFDGLPPSEMAHFLVSSHEKMERLTEHGIEYVVYITHPYCLFPPEYINKLEESGRLVSGCQAQRGNGIIIDERGDILPCNHFCRSSLGSLDECTTGKNYMLWRHTEPIVRFYKRMTDYPTRSCVTCPSWKKCGGGCRIHWLKFGEQQMLDLKKAP